MRKKILFISFFLVEFAFLPLLAQIGSFYTTDNYLSNSLINSIYQDSRKYIWIATEDGLNKFDGVRFTVYRNQKDDKFSLKNNYVRSVFEDSKGRIWVGCINGLQIYNRAEDKFIEIPVYYQHRKIEPHITSIIELSNGEILLSSSGAGVIRSSQDFKSFSVDEHLFYNLNSRYLIALQEDRKGQLWIASENQGVNMYHLKSGRLLSFSYPSTIGSNHISSIVEDKNGNIYVGTLTAGLQRYNQLSRNFEQVKYSNSSVALPIRCLSFDNKGRLLAGTDGLGIKYLNDASGLLEDYRLILSVFDISKTKVHALYSDKSGNLWIGLFQKGVFLSPNRSNDFNYWGAKSFYRNIVGSNSVMSLLEDKQGTVWVGTDNDGLYELKGDKSTHYSIKSNNNGASGTIMSILEGDQNNLWLGTYTNGLIRFNKSTGAIKPYLKKDSESIKNANSSSNRVMSIAYDNQKRIWIGTNGAGVQIFDPVSSKFVEQLVFNDKDSSGIVNDWVNCILNDGDSLMWIGTYCGVSSVNLKTGNIQSFRNADRIVLAGKIVLSILRDSRGLIWFGTTEGLTQYNPKTQAAEHFTIKDGLAGNAICGIIEDENGNLWLSTRSGVSNLIVSKKHVINYNVYDGLQGNEFSAGAAYRNAVGEIFFGGINGVTSFFPSQITERKAPLELNLTGFYIYDQLVVKGQKSGSRIILDEFVSDVKKIKLDYRDAMFSFEFSTFDYGSRGRVFYRYKMEGLNNHWIMTERGTNRIVFSNLGPGHYQLHVKACINDKESEEKIWEIIIYPPWYWSMWAKLVYLILFLLIVWVVYRIVKERINSRNELLRREHLEEINEGKLQFFINISHEIRTPMSLIMSPLEKLISEETETTKKDIYSLIYRNAQRILRLVNQLLDVRKIDKGQMFVKMRETNIVPLIDDLMHTFEYQASRREIRFDFIHDMPELKVWIDPNNFDKVLINILSNAFKFTPDKGAIVVCLNVYNEPGVSEAESNGFFEIIVSDNGIGIEEDKIEKIFERFYQIDNSQSNINFGTGIGLHLAKNLIELMHGKIYARNKKNKSGSEFIVKMPLGNSHLSKNEMEIETENQMAMFNDLTVNEVEPDVVQLNHFPKYKAKTKYKVLIVDDEDEIRQYLSLQLSDTYRVAESSNGKDALDYILKEKPDLVITDIMMPEMDGITLCKKIKSNANINHIPVILLTAKSSDEDKADGYDIGADGYVSKPFNLELLKKLVANILSNREIIHHKSFGEGTDLRIKPVILKSNDQVLFERIMKVINENIGNPDLNVEMLADQIGMSRVHMHRRLKELTNMSARDFIKSVRLKQAANLLVKQKLTVSEVAYALGFGNLSHFSNSFKEFYGKSPKEYSNENKKQTENS